MSDHSSHSGGPHEGAPHGPHAAADKHDCGCGCGGGGDCEEARKPINKARRALMIGAGTVAFVSTLPNRRAFAGNAQCGPISHAASLTNSAPTTGSGCGGLTPGFWKNHATCTSMTLGHTPTNAADAINYCTTVATLGSKLSNLNTYYPAVGSLFFTAALCNNGSIGFHIAGAILDALSPQFNPSYGYTITELNNAIKFAFQQGLSATQIATALATLENDMNTNTGNCDGGNSQHLC